MNNETFMEQHSHPIVNGVIGVASTFTGIAVSLSTVEAWLRIGSLTIGILVGLASLYSILKKGKSK